MLGGTIVLTNQQISSLLLRHELLYLVVKVFGAIISHGHDVGIVVLVVIVKAVKKEAKTNPSVN